jgi:tungstate transport system ATP-binding protein
MNSPGRVIFEVEGLRHEYGGVTVLDIPRMSLARGRIFALVGPNGSGKTTLLSILNLLTRPTAGSIRYQGSPVGTGESVRRRQRLSMSFLLQDPYLFNTTVNGNVSWGLSARGVPREEIPGLTARALEMVGLEGFGERRARTLSGGESQRTALARALVTEPDVLLLDEPTANIDPASAAAFESAIRRINREKGVTVIMTTHNLGQARRLGDEIYTLFSGQLIPSPMDNLFTGSLLEKGGHPVFKTGVLSMHVSPTDTPFEVTHALIPPGDILVSLESIVSSARNVLPGKVNGISEQPASVRIRVKAGEVFTVDITPESFRELELSLGSDVYLTFKASSVQLL